MNTAPLISPRLCSTEGVPDQDAVATVAAGALCERRARPGVVGTEAPPATPGAAAGISASGAGTTTGAAPACVLPPDPEAVARRRAAFCFVLESSLKVSTDPWHSLCGSKGRLGLAPPGPTETIEEENK